MNKNLKAFPSDQTKTDRYGNVQETHFEAGMTLRDYFAAKAMQAYIMQNSSSTLSIEKVMQYRAESSYEMADAMLKQRDL